MVCYDIPVRELPHHTTNQPQDFSDEWQDLDDLLEEALEEGGSATLRSGGNVPAVDTSNIDEKLSKLDRLGTDPEELAAARVDAVGDKAAKAMEAFLGGEGRAGRGQDELGEEEERLLQMVSQSTMARYVACRT